MTHVAGSEESFFDCSVVEGCVAFDALSLLFEVILENLNP